MGGALPQGANFAAAEDHAAAQHGSVEAAEAPPAGICPLTFLGLGPAPSFSLKSPAESLGAECRLAGDRLLATTASELADASLQTAPCTCGAAAGDARLGFRGLDSGFRC